MQKLLPFEHTGNKKSKTLVVLLHGFPDSTQLWNGVLSRISAQDAQFLAISYPNYHAAEKLKLGQSQPQIVERIKQTVDFVDDNQGLNKVFVAHDWGAFFAYMLDQRYPKYMNDLITLDVSPEFERTTKAFLGIMCYQIIFACCFILGLFPFFGQKLGTFIVRLYMNNVFRVKTPASLSCDMCYLYFYLWLNFLTVIVSRDKSRLFLKKYTPSVPIVYIYGGRKPFQFHNQRWQLLLSKNKDSEFIEANTGHWIMNEAPDLVSDKIIQRIKRLKSI